ncbi:J domain-containing protein [Marinobacter sp. SS21]|uniref:J domain-containing protein n=1 Tax=Marinobacter sp. SS21 TaxID=2979460 RepID=UPI00232BCE93|nr:J domain-containing protein [Marinobacter sp. SS21]MDC0663392.1 J domain-containing protein [Marinobacter sp. SS21]
MSCWDVLGIEPTRDPGEIERAYRQQVKFVEAANARQLDDAYRDAMAQAGQAAYRPAQAQETRDDISGSQPSAAELGAAEHQLVREVVIQVNALLNDTARSGDVGIWKAVLTDPPADQAPLKQAIAGKLEGQLRPMARQGDLAADVASFLASWFGWDDVADSEAVGASVPSEQPASAGRSEGLERVEGEQQQPAGNFWPAAIGWIVALIVLTSLFSNLTGQ